MPEKETSKQKVKRASLSAIQTAFILSAVFSSFGIVISLLFLILSLFREVYHIELFAVYLISFLCSTFFVTKLEKILQQLRPEREKVIPFRF